jgi:hypothetical protein
MITHTNAELTVTCNKKMIGLINAMQFGGTAYCFALTKMLRKALGGTEEATEN